MRIDWRMIGVFIMVFLLMLLLLFSCSQEQITSSNPCITGNCDVKIVVSNGIIDSDGFIHLTLNEGYYTYFNTFVEASEVKDKYKYNGVSVVEAYFDTDTYWIISDSLAIRLPLYSPFGGLRSSPYWSSTKLPVGDTLIYLSQYAGYIVPVVQDSRIYLQKYEENPYGYTSEYKPQEDYYWGKRIVGPIPKGMKGDTIQLFTKIFWEAGNSSIEKNNIITKIILE